MENAPRPCVLFLTHRWSPSIAAHYARLKREAGAILDVYLVLQVPRKDSAPPAGAEPDIVVDLEAIAATFPLRFAEYGSPSEALFGCTETVWMTACRSPLLASYGQFWVLEYDVDYSGDWGDFFRLAIGYEGDVLGVDLRHLSSTPTWVHGRRFRQPANAVPDPIIGFFPVARIGRRFLETYHQTVATPGWQGHFEMVVPSVAVAHGFSVREIGGDGPMTPSERRYLHYAVRRRGGARRSTFGFRPPVAYRYYDEAPRDFALPKMLYHPVKPDTSLATRFRYAYQAYVGHPWVKIRNRILGRD